MAGKRLLETGQWVLAATAPGNMRPGHAGSGIAACIRVRLVHAYVRRHMLAGEDWDLARDGVPLNATDTAATLTIGFFALHVEGVTKIGTTYSPAEKEAVAHMWRWIAHVMGVAADLQPHSYERAEEIYATQMAVEQSRSAQAVAA